MARELGFMGDEEVEIWLPFIALLFVISEFLLPLQDISSLLLIEVFFVDDICLIILFWVLSS